MYVVSSVFWFVNYCFLPFLRRTIVQKWKKNWVCYFWSCLPSWWVFLQGNENVRSVQVYILLYLRLVWIRRIRRQEEFKIPMCNSSGGNLLRQSCQTSMTELLSSPPKHVDCFRKKTPPQTSDWILNADPTRGAAKVECGWNVSAWNSWCRLVWKELVESVSNYKKSCFWWYGNPICGDSTGSTGLKKIRLMYLLHLFEGRGEKGQCDLVCV